MDSATFLSKIFGKVTDEVGNRSVWETEQQQWYDMRHDGIPRPSKPWVGAADMHMPIADSLINQFKPLYFNQLFASELIATFVADKQELVNQARMAEQFFDYCLRYKSNLETSILTTIDYFLVSGQSLCKTTWDHEKDALKYDGIDPYNIIVPFYTKELQDADWICQVIPISEQAYRANPAYLQDDDFIKSIKGSSPTEGQQTTFITNKFVREGLTYSEDDDGIILWEYWTRKEVDGVRKWCYTTFSPMNMDREVTPFRPCPYDHGMAPYCYFSTEIKDKGFYSPRGLPEMVKMEEAQGNKLLNEKNDAITLSNRPMFTSDTPVTNQNNFTLKPGQFVSGNVRSVVMQAPPIDYDREMNNTRSMAEKRVGAPDFAINSDQPELGHRTATEVKIASGLGGVTMDLRSRIFRKQIGVLFEQSWALIRQYKKENFKYYYNEEMREADSNILADSYMILASGTIDSYNRQLQLQKAVNRWQMFNNDPYIDQVQLRMSILEQDDPRLIKRLLKTDQDITGDQTDKQMMECVVLEQGGTQQVDQNDNHLVHMQVQIGRVQFLSQAGVKMNQFAVQRSIQHFGQHKEAFVAQKGAQAEQGKQLEMQMMQVIQQNQGGNNVQALQQPVPQTA